MAQIFDDGINYTKGFIFASNQPLDLRAIQEKKDDLNNLNTKYNGMLAYVTGYYDGKNHDAEAGSYVYIQNSGATPNASTKLVEGKWVKFMSPGGTISSDSLPSYVDDIVEGDIYAYLVGDIVYKYFKYTDLHGKSKVVGESADGTYPYATGSDTITEAAQPGIIYVAKNTTYDDDGNVETSEVAGYRAYRWSGSKFIEIISQHVSAITIDQINDLF